MFTYLLSILALRHKRHYEIITAIIKGIGTSTAGTTPARPIFQRAQSKFLALYAHTIIIIFSALCNPNGARNGFISTSASLDFVVIIPNKFHSSQDILFPALVWIKEQKMFIQARVE